MRGEAIRGGMSDQALRVWEGGYETKMKDSRVVAGATRLHLNRDFRVTSQPLGACLTPVPALGGTGWPSFGVTPPNGGDLLLWEKALCVWLNTTPGLIARWWVSSRQQQGRARLTITTLGTIPVIDLRNLSQQQLQKLAAVFDAFSGRDLLPANQADRDSVRHVPPCLAAQRPLHSTRRFDRHRTPGMVRQAGQIPVQCHSLDWRQNPTRMPSMLGTDQKQQENQKKEHQTKQDRLLHTHKKQCDVLLPRQGHSPCQISRPLPKEHLRHNRMERVLRATPPSRELQQHPERQRRAATPMVSCSGACTQVHCDSDDVRRCRNASDTSRFGRQPQPR